MEKDAHFFRNIMQDYARAAIKAATLVNSGAIIVVISQLANLAQFIPLSAIKLSVLGYVLGLISVLAASITGFMSARSSARLSEGNEVARVSPSWLTNIGLGLVLFSVASFCIASFGLIASMAPQQPPD